VLGLVIVTLAILRFRRFLAPAPVRHRRAPRTVLASASERA
jgi:hypothetical protein